MSDSVPQDFAIFGLSPLAGLLAAVLAADHGKTVVLVGERHSPLRLPRTLHLSVSALTRPESWDLLREMDAETAALLATAGATQALSRIDVHWRADLAHTAEALEHVRHLALGFGLAAERPKSGMGLTVHGVGAVSEDLLAPVLDAWLQRLGVVRLLAADTTLTLQKNGSGTLVTAERTLKAKQVILADDAALLALLDPATWPETLHAIEATATLTSPVKAAPMLVHFPDRGVSVSRRGEGLLVHIAGSSDAEARLGASLAEQLPLVRRATRKYRKVETRDGGPVVGWSKAQRLGVIAGLGDSATFHAPVLARLLTGTATAEEKRWAAPRDLALRDVRARVADFVAGAFQ